MPITRSAKKASRQSKKKRVRNIRATKKIRKLLKEAKVLAEQKNIQKLKEILPKTYQALDKGAKTGLIKKNTAARKKSQMAKLVKTDA